MVASEEQILVQIGRIYSGTGVVSRDVMAYTDSRGRWWCSYRRGTLVVCSANLLLAICVLHAAVSPLQMKSSPNNLVMLPTGGVQAGVTYVTKKELERRVESNRQRRALLPLHLIQRVKEIEAETEIQIDNSRKSNQARQKVADELAQRLREIRQSHSQFNKEGLEAWRKKRLQDVITQQLKPLEESKPSGILPSRKSLDLNFVQSKFARPGKQLMLSSLSQLP